MKLNRIIQKMENIASIKLAENKWDNSGLQVGDENSEIRKIMLVLDVTIEVVNRAIEQNVDLIISHHPMLFSNIKKIDKRDKKGKIIFELIKNDIAVYSAHTNLDACLEGVSVQLAKKLEIDTYKILDITQSEKIYKLCVFVPVSHSEEVREAIINNGAGHIGNYSHCSFCSKGEGTFKPLDGTNPFIGEKNILEKVNEVKIESIICESKIEKVLKEMLKVHPYEEVAYDLFEINGSNIEYGYGRVGDLEISRSLKSLAKDVKDKLNCDYVKFYGDENRSIKKVALSGGDGTEFIEHAIRENVDVFITGDIRHHDVQLANENNLCLIDASHFNTEVVILPVLKEMLLGKIDNDIEIIIDSNNYFKAYYI